MGYLRGFSEKGIAFDAATKTFTLMKPSAESERFLDKRYARKPDGSGWTFHRPSMLEKAGSLGRAIGSTVVNGPAPPDVVSKRVRSCLGDATTPPCTELARTSTGAYCTACDCGRWLVARLDGARSPRFKLANVTCPLGRPGFSNEVTP